MKGMDDPPTTHLLIRSRWNRIFQKRHIDSRCGNAAGDLGGGALIRPPLITIIGHSVPGEWTRPGAVNLLLLFLQISPHGISLGVRKQPSVLNQTASLSLCTLMTETTLVFIGRLNPCPHAFLYFTGPVNYFLLWLKAFRILNTNTKDAFW